MYYGIQFQRAILQEVLIGLVLKMCWDITLLKSQPYLPGVNELMQEKDEIDPYRTTTNQSKALSMDIDLPLSINS